MSELRLAALLALGCLALLAVTGRLRFVAEEFPGQARRVLATALLFAIFTACIFHPAVSAEAATRIDPDDLWFPGLFAGHALFAGVLYVWWRLRPGLRLADFLLLRDLRLADVGYGVRLGMVGWLLTLAASAALGIATGSTGVTEAPEAIPPMIVWLAELPLSQKLLVIAAAMTVEEAFFRAFLQTRIGWIPSSLLFALGHASYGLPLLMASVLVISLVMGWGLRQTGRLLPCIVAHGFFDAVQLLVVVPWAVRMLTEGTPTP